MRVEIEIDFTDFNKEINPYFKEYLSKNGKYYQFMLRSVIYNQQKIDDNFTDIHNSILEGLEDSFRQYKFSSINEVHQYVYRGELMNDVIYELNKIIDENRIE